jgi:hypothetical protein
MNVSVAVVHHRHGVDVLLAKTPKRLTERLAAYATDWWSEVSNRSRPPASWSADRVVRTYFAKRESEDYDRYDNVTVED